MTHDNCSVAITSTVFKSWVSQAAPNRNVLNVWFCRVVLLKFLMRVYHICSRILGFTPDFDV